MHTNHQLLNKFLRYFRNRLEKIERHYSIDFSKYLRYEQIIDYLQTLSNRRQCDITTVGKTEEGRPIIAVKIGSSNARTIVIESGVHAREWVTPMTALYVIERLLNNYEFVDGLQWIIIPLLNPDGYDYSWSPDFKNRLWRKNRANTIIDHCKGVDINRNFSFHWKDEYANMCNDPCKEDYRGIYPWSEPETRAIKELVTDIGPKIALYISVHNYLQGIMFPWGYTGHPPDDVNDLMSLASEAQTAVREKYGTKYRVGQIPTIDRLTPGCSVDWAKAEANIRFCYSFELPGPTYKFQVPPPHLLKIAEEFFEALKVFAEAVKQNKI